jgi:hypothetical protein
LMHGSPCKVLVRQRAAEAAPVAAGDGRRWFLGTT